MKMDKDDYEIQYHTRASIFEYQDPESPCFNVIFNVEGQAIYADQMTLASASEVFEKLFSQHGKPDEPVNQPIRIENYSYKEFFEFLKIIYRGFFTPDEKNAYLLIQLSARYNIYWIFKKCDKYDMINEEIESKNDELNDEEIEEFYDRLEFAFKFKMEVFKISLGEFFKKHLFTFISNDDFLNLEKSVIKNFVTFNMPGKQLEILFRSVYKWAQHQALKKEDEENFDLAVEVKNEMADVLPLCKFKKMRFKFLMKFVVPKGLITNDDAKEYKTINVTVRSNRQQIYGSFVDVFGIYEIIKYEYGKKLYDHGILMSCTWNKRFTIPSTQSAIKKMKGCEWYLLLDLNGGLAIKHRSLVQKRQDYLLAEMKDLNGSNESFTVNENDYISIIVSR